MDDEWRLFREFAVHHRSSTPQSPRKLSARASEPQSPRKLRAPGKSTLQSPRKLSVSSRPGKSIKKRSTMGASEKRKVSNAGPMPKRPRQMKSINRLRNVGVSEKKRKAGNAVPKPNSSKAMKTSVKKTADKGIGKVAMTSKSSRVPSSAMKKTEHCISDMPPSKGVLVWTGKEAVSSYITQRCKRAAGQTVGQVVGAFRLKDATGTVRTYNPRDLRYDLLRGFLRVKGCIEAKRKAARKVGTAKSKARKVGTVMNGAKVIKTSTKNASNKITERSKYVLVWTGKESKENYITNRCKRAAGLTVGKAISAFKIKDAAGRIRLYRMRDLKYDLMRGFLLAKRRSS